MTTNLIILQLTKTVSNVSILVGLGTQSSNVRISMDILINNLYTLFNEVVQVVLVVTVLEAANLMHIL